MTDPQVPDAKEAPPWNKGRDGAEPTVKSFAPLDRPRMRVHFQGEWRPARVLQQQVWEDGRIRLQCEVYRRGDDGFDWYVHAFWWSRESMRPIRPARPARPEPAGWMLAHDPAVGGVLHRADCPQAVGGRLDRAAALLALGEDYVRGCSVCEPERELRA